MMQDFSFTEFCDSNFRTIDTTNTSNIKQVWADKYVSPIKIALYTIIIFEILFIILLMILWM